MRDARHLVGEVVQQPAHVVHGPWPVHQCVSSVSGSGPREDPSPLVRPRCTPRWYAESRPRTSSGVRLVRAVVLRASTAPGTSWAAGTRLGSPDRVVPPSLGAAAADAARQPWSADVRQASSAPVRWRIAIGSTGG